MSPTPFDWSKLIADLTDETFGIPPDVVFQIVEKDQMHEIMAHKTIFAMISPFFRTMFFSMVAGDKTAKVFKIEKTTASAFQIIKDAIYNNKSIEDSLQGKSVDEVFHVVELIERLQTKELMEVMKEYLANFSIIKDETVLEVAEEAMEYSALFKAESDQLLHTCAQFLIPKLKDIKCATRYAKENQDRKEVVATLLALMDDILPSECTNCKKEVCQDGQVINDDEFWEGLLVTNNRAIAWKRLDYGTGKITKLESDSLTMMVIKPGVTQNGLTGASFLDFVPYAKGHHYYLFSCK